MAPDNSSSSGQNRINHSHEDPPRVKNARRIGRDFVKHSEEGYMGNVRRNNPFDHAK
jgi:hypothetical protein